MVRSYEHRSDQAADSAVASVSMMSRPLNLTEIAMRLHDGSLDESKVSPEILKRARRIPIVMGGEGKIDKPSRLRRSDRFLRSPLNAVRQ